MAIAGSAKIEAARTFFQTISSEVFAGNRQALNAVFCRSLPANGKYFELDVMGATPAVSEIKGSRTWGSLRAYVNHGEVLRYGPAGLEIPIIDIEADNTGMIASQLAAYVRDNASFYEKPIFDFLISNPTCLDGGALLSTTHSYGAAGGTWSNKTTTALAPDIFFTTYYGMTGLQLENGEPAGYMPKVLMVGTSNQKMAFDLTGSDRVVPIAATGLEAYASAVAAAAKSNWVTPMGVVVAPRFTGSYATDWLLIDNTNEQARPIVLGEAIAPGFYSIVNPESSGMADRSVARFYGEAQACILGSVPMGIAGLLA